MLAEVSVSTVMIILLHALYQHLLNACMPLLWVPYEVSVCQGLRRDLNFNPSQGLRPQATS